MEWIYLSPHFDDIALSCGGLVWEQVRAGDHASVWTICAGRPPDVPLSPFAELLHARWQTGPEAVELRRGEDIASCAQMGAAYRHFSIPDCIYRRSPLDGTALYASEESISGPLHPHEEPLIEALHAELDRALPGAAELVSPLALGGHVDHRLTRAAAERLGRRLWYYADYPYVLRNAGQVEALRETGWQEDVFPISPQGLDAWERAVAAHASQISTFWPDPEAMRLALHDYSYSMGGAALWRAP
ncbi:MAG TPA: PIG-L family deacetylase [Anaerolineales bacterium]